MKGYKGEVLVQGVWSQNAIVWPDMESAEKAAADLFSRWTATADYRAVEVDEAPTRPSWDEWVKEHGFPPRSIQL